MDAAPQRIEIPTGFTPRMIRGAWVAGTACVFLAVGVDGFLAKSRGASRASASAWAAPVDEAAIYSASSLHTDSARTEASPAVGRSRTAAGSAMLIAVLVHAIYLDEITVARIGGLYGP